MITGKNRPSKESFWSSTKKIDDLVQNSNSEWSGSYSAFERPGMVVISNALNRRFRLLPRSSEFRRLEISSHRLFKLLLGRWLINRAACTAGKGMAFQASGESLASLEHRYILSCFCCFIASIVQTVDNFLMAIPSCTIMYHHVKMNLKWNLWIDGSINLIVSNSTRLLFSILHNLYRLSRFGVCGSPI